MNNKFTHPERLNFTLQTEVALKNTTEFPLKFLWIFSLFHLKDNITPVYNKHLTSLKTTDHILNEENFLRCLPKLSM